MRNRWRTQDHHPEEQVAAVHLVAEVADEERGGRPHRKECRRDVPSQVPALPGTPPSCHWTSARPWQAQGRWP